MEISRNENTLIINNNLYKAKEIKEERNLCNICDLYNKECKKAPCLKSERLDNREIVFKFIKKVR